MKFIRFVVPATGAGWWHSASPESMAMDVTDCALPITADTASELCAAWTPGQRTEFDVREHGWPRGVRCEACEHGWQWTWDAAREARRVAVRRPVAGRSLGATVHRA